ncbi:MAG: hypothetical protein KTR21_17780 [Rhodobacteraceae bacterium]|nr:hypothetical protein [Paracoccaceae bacterium]
MVTVAGRICAPRVTASMLSQLELHEGVATDVEDYTNTVIELALNADRRKAIRRRLADLRNRTEFFSGPAI